MDISQANEWQFIDERINLIFPWYVKSFLDVLKTWDLSDKIVFEYGLGYSTIWWAKNCKSLSGVDNSLNWISEVDVYLKDLGLHSKANLFYVPVEDADCNTANNYVISTIIATPTPDIIVIDGCFRDESIITAIEAIKPGGIIICDNWMQEGVWICQCPELLTKYEHYIYKQEGHPHWQTAYFIINKIK